MDPTIRVGGVDQPVSKWYSIGRLLAVNLVADAFPTTTVLDFLA